MTTGAQSNRQRKNPWAVASFLCSLAIVCPPLTLLAPLLAIRALIQIKTKPNQIGQRLAIAAIVIGVMVSTLWLLGGWWWHVNARVPMLYGPRDAIRSGLAGDFDTFRSHFYGGAASSSDDEIANFLNQLSSRYGKFIDAHVKEDATPVDENQPRGSMAIPYLMEFEKNTVDAEAQFVMTENLKLPFILKFEWIRIIDSDNGDVVYPINTTP